VTSTPRATSALVNLELEVEEGSLATRANKHTRQLIYTVHCLLYYCIYLPLVPLLAVTRSVCAAFAFSLSLPHRTCGVDVATLRHCLQMFIKHVRQVITRFLSLSYADV
jgi:hypothetical protein